MYKLEISTYTIDGVEKAYEYGVHRVELCDNVKEGGTTPSCGFVKAALEINHPEIHVIVRPRGGDFLYSDAEFIVMKNDIKQLKELGVDGVVSGILLDNGDIDIDRTKELVELAHPMDFTFHRAFDMARDYKKALEDLKNIGVTRLLTSGQEDKVENGISVIKYLIDNSEGKISILLGSGVTPSNMKFLKDKTGAVEFHMSANKQVESGMKFFNSRLNMGSIESEEYSKIAVDDNKIASAIEVINSFKKETHA